MSIDAASGPYAKVVADSITEGGRRLTTFEVRCHRFVLAEFNTHRVLSRNSASSRAIPVEKTLERVQDTPAWPLSWPSEKPGMQGGEPLEEDALLDAKAMFANVWYFTSHYVGDYLAQHPEKASRLHKSLVNRLMEPFMWHTIVVTATAWENFFRQRVSPLAQPEIRVVAEAMLDAQKNSTPRLLASGDYHLPYVWDDPEVIAWADEHADSVSPTRLLVEISSARCARVSYLTQDGRRDPEEDRRLYRGNDERPGLVTAEPMHASPLEHVATPASWNERRVILRRDSLGRLYEVGEEGPDTTTLVLPKVGNFLGWMQHRLEVEMTREYQFYA